MEHSDALAQRAVVIEPFCCECVALIPIRRRPRPDRSRPNILWICTEQQRFDALGCHGNTFVHTPNVDRLAHDGVLFERCYSHNPVCTPSRASFLTGRYPRTTGCRQNGQSIPDSEVLITKMLADAGYICDLSGKLHLCACHPSACPGTERRIDDEYDEFHWSHDSGPYWPTNEYFHWLREKGVAHETEPFEGSQYVRTGMPSEHHQTTWCAQKAINFIEANAYGEDPWLFSVNIFDPHHAFDPPIEYLVRYLDRLDEIPLPNYVLGELDSKPVWQRIDHGGAYGFRYEDMTERDHRLVRAAYWAVVDLIDSQVGRMLDALKATGRLENTLVIFTSDHGEMLGDHGIYLRGPYFYEPAIRVPLIISWPGVVESATRTDALVELVDLAPSMLDACGTQRHPGMQGWTLWPGLLGEASLAGCRDDVYCEFYGSDFRYAPGAYTTMVRTERYKLAVAHGQNTGELYDLENDPSETINCWVDPACAGVRLEMMTRLADRIGWTVDPLPEREAP